MSKLLDPNTFGEKLYNTLPQMYRSDDATVGYALRRYLQSTAEGGFSHVISEINDLLDLNDPDKCPEEFLELVFKQYGFEAFNGIPEVYLRKLLPLLGELYNRKGTTTVIEYLTSVISGIKTDIAVSPNFSQDYTVNLRFEMDWDEQNFPNKNQLLRIIKEFIPFFVEVVVVLIYMFYESVSLKTEEKHLLDIQTVPYNDDTNLSTKEYTHEILSTTNEDSCEFYSTNTFRFSNVLNAPYAVLNGDIYLNKIMETDECFDIIRVNGEITQCVIS